MSDTPRTPLREALERVIAETKLVPLIDRDDDDDGPFEVYVIEPGAVEAVRAALRGAGDTPPERRRISDLIVARYEPMLPEGDPRVRAAADWAADDIIRGAGDTPAPPLAKLLDELLDEAQRVYHAKPTVTTAAYAGGVSATRQAILAALRGNTPAQEPLRLPDWDAWVEVGFLDAYLNIRGVKDEAEAAQMLRAAIDELAALSGVPVERPADAQTEDLLAALAERNIHCRGDLELALDPRVVLDPVLSTAKALADELRWCNRHDDCHVKAEGADLVISDIEHEWRRNDPEAVGVPVEPRPPETQE